MRIRMKFQKDVGPIVESDFRRSGPASFISTIHEKTERTIVLESNGYSWFSEVLPENLIKQFGDESELTEFHYERGSRVPKWKQARFDDVHR